MFSSVLIGSLYVLAFSFQNCVLSKEAEEAATAKFKANFKAYDFTLLD